ncbi:S-adenosyl-L-methionine-dependent methyltransferase [Vigna unguiculata]|uniref:S-adenosyl-L-methionine-dependent methyltransferase n=1 Tax=Vigna unguiculata TaxID=3917 RepID=A0A4D6NFL2_VIGUN|nr:S-adenosyl-L-methionine-dependent methyltransferase [Vigna unguiculata]
MASNNGLKASEIFEGQVHLYKHLNACPLDGMSLKWMIDLGIPDIIHNHDQPITLSELVSILQIPPTKVRGVKSLLRYLAHNGFLQIVRVHHNTQEKEAYALTAASQLLLKGNDLSLAPMVELLTNPRALFVWFQLKKWTYEDDLTLSDVSLGSNIWDFLGKNPENNKLFNESMASDSQMMNLALQGTTRDEASNLALFFLVNGGLLMVEVCGCYCDDGGCSCGGDCCGCHRCRLWWRCVNAGELMIASVTTNRSASVMSVLVRFLERRPSSCFGGAAPSSSLAQSLNRCHRATIVHPSWVTNLWQFQNPNYGIL